MWLRALVKKSITLGRKPLKASDYHSIILQGKLYPEVFEGPGVLGFLPWTQPCPTSLIFSPSWSWMCRKATCVHCSSTPLSTVFQTPSCWGPGNMTSCLSLPKSGTADLCPQTQLLPFHFNLIHHTLPTVYQSILRYLWKNLKRSIKK